MNLLATLTEPGGAKTTFEYNSGHRRTSTAYPNGVTMTQGYDKAGRLTSIIGQDARGATLTSFSYTYTSGSGADTALRQSVTDKDGNRTGYSYDVLSRLAGAQTATGDGTVTASYSYSYDGANNRTSKTVNGVTTNYAYNDANQLTSLTVGGGTTTFSYDANGNETGNSAGRAFAYNAKNQTTSVTPAGGSAIPMDYTGASQVQRVSAGEAQFTHTLLGLSSERTGLGSTYYTRGERGELISQWSEPLIANHERSQLAPSAVCAASNSAGGR